MPAPENSGLRGVLAWLTLFLLGLAILVAHSTIWDDFIRNEFPYQGEAFYKSDGQIFRDNFGKGLFLVFMNPMSFWLVVAFVMLTLLPQERVTIRIITLLTAVYAALILLYGGMKVYDLYAGTFDNKERVTAIVSAGMGRVLGIILGRVLAVKTDVYGRLNALLARTKYQAHIHGLN